MLHSGVNIPNHDLVQSSEISIVKCNTLFNSCNNYLYRYEHDSILLKKKEKHSLNIVFLLVQLLSPWKAMPFTLKYRSKYLRVLLSFALRLGIYSQSFPLMYILCLCQSYAPYYLEIQNCVVQEK